MTGDTTRSDLTNQETRDVTLPGTVVDRIERRLPGTRFQTVDEYAAVALEMLLREVDGDGGIDETDVSPGTADARETGVENEEAVQERLESLGYL